MILDGFILNPSDVGHDEPICNIVPIVRLCQDNYMLGHEQQLMILHGRHALAFIEGSKMVPASTITVSETIDGKMVSYPVYAEWLLTDKQILGNPDYTRA
jgi:hypothetical protein